MKRLRVYISSTFEDLKEYRAAVFTALEKAGLEIARMEAYTAADERPLDLCLNDVSQSEIYVGLYAWRYGYSPPVEHGNPKGKSITELEYRQAEASKLRKLLFFAHPDTKAQWPDRFKDEVTGEGERGEKLNTFREELANEKTPDFFRTPDDLATRVLASIMRSGLSGRPYNALSRPPGFVRRQGHHMLGRALLFRAPEIIGVRSREPRSDLLVPNSIAGAIEFLICAGAVSRSNTRERRKVIIPPGNIHAVYSYFGRDAPFRRCDASEIPCVITDQPSSVWHHLNRNHQDNSIANLIRLTANLNEVIGRASPNSEIADIVTDCLLTRANQHFRDWRGTDAYACAHLAFWMAEWLAPSESVRQVKCICSALRYARHTYHPEILASLIKRLHSKLTQAKLGWNPLIEILTELTSVYAWVGAAEKDKDAAEILADILVRTKYEDYETPSYQVVGSKKRRIAQTVSICSPNNRDAVKFLAEANEMAEALNDRTDIKNTKATLAIAHYDRKAIKESYEWLYQRAHNSQHILSPVAPKPIEMTLNNAIAEMWYLLLSAVNLGKEKVADEAYEKLRILVGPREDVHHYLSPPPTADSWLRAEITLISSIGAGGNL
jgi:hypothetical protein